MPVATRAGESCARACCSTPPSGVPGSEAAVRLAWERLIAPELGHVLRELRKDAGRP
mgnify:CR=1 FL=1